MKLNGYQIVSEEIETRGGAAIGGLPGAVFGKAIHDAGIPQKIGSAIKTKTKSAASKGYQSVKRMFRSSQQ